MPQTSRTAILLHSTYLNGHALCRPSDDNKSKEALYKARTYEFVHSEANSGVPVVSNHLKKTAVRGVFRSEGRFAMLTFLLAAFGCTNLLNVSAQQAGNLSTERHPTLTWQRCTTSDGCQTVNASIVLDAEWRWVHKVNDLHSCYTGNSWAPSWCPDNRSCAKNCAVDGVYNYADNGVVTSGDALTIRHRAGSTSQRLGARVYLLENETSYQLFDLRNREFSVDVDVSALPCDVDGAVSFLQMDVDGGIGRFEGNTAGAKFGTGFCSARCPKNVKFINGEANSEGWTPDNTDSTTGRGKYGSCCTEVDVWDANSVANALTVHSCTADRQSKCDGGECGTDAEPYGGICDPDGCDFNPYRLGNQSFYGSADGNTVDSRRKLTVVTQFITDSGATDGALTEIRRLYVQDGKIIANPTVQVSGANSTFDSLSEGYCSSQKSGFGDEDAFGKHGGLKQVGKGLEAGMVLSFSLLSDPSHFYWLDARYPTNKDPSLPGVVRGPCSNDAVAPPTDPESQWRATYSNIKFGDIGSTFNGTS